MVLLFSVAIMTVVMYSLFQMVKQLKNVSNNCDYNNALQGCNCRAQDGHMNIFIHIRSCSHISYVIVKIYHACGGLGYSMGIYITLNCRLVVSFLKEKHAKVCLSYCINVICI